MEFTTTYRGDGITEIAVDFNDEGVDLQGTTTVIGDEAKARSYAQIFAQDLRRNNRHKFPLPQPAELEEEL